MKKFNLSANIENGWDADTQYISTPNARKAALSIVDGFHSGIHSFTVIGTYGTGKSSFLLALEHDLNPENSKKYLLGNPKVLSDAKSFDILNIVGDYEDLSTLMARKLNVESSHINVLDCLKERYDECCKEDKFLLVVIDEFGKILEHAAEKNPNKELYFLQKLAELVNVTSRNIILITTLHQNFNAYGKKLSEEQKNEWTKVKGRFHEIVFVEPVEQIIFLAAKQYKSHSIVNECKLRAIQELAIKTHFVSDSYSYEAARDLWPLDPFSAYVITKAIQRYGQNERSLFTFLSTRGRNSFAEYKSKDMLSYNLQKVYDYIEGNFYSYLQEANADSMAWSGMHTAIERVEGHNWDNEDDFKSALKIVKAIGLMNLFGTAAFSLKPEDMATYAKLAMGIDNAEVIIRQLTNFKIIKFAAYKERLILFEGTDVNIEDELAKASLVIPKPVNYIDDIWYFFTKRISIAKACYYHKGTPRYFKYNVLAEPEDITPNGDIDGYVELLFPAEKSSIADIKQFSSNTDKAIIFAVFCNTKRIVAHIYNINRYDYVLQRVLIDKNDTVAIREVNNLKEHEIELLNKAINEDLVSYGKNVTWIYKGEEKSVRSQRDFNKLLSTVCDDVYYLTPTLNNELFNKHKLSGSISAAKVKYFQALLENSNKIDLGFDKDKFPPEKTIYYSLLRNTGLHINGEFTDVPTNRDIQTLWDACEDFLNSTRERPRNLSELVKILSSQPYKIKDGVLEFWIPTYLFIKRQDFSIYGANGQYIPSFNMELFDLMKKHIGEFKIKAYSVDGIKLAMFNQYRKFLNLDGNKEIKGKAFIETIKPFLFFYNHQLNEYAKHTKSLPHEETIRFREVLAHAKDPEKAFLEDMPKALGYTDEMLSDESQVQNYCNIIQRAVRELRGCYNQLIDRLENDLIERLGLQSGDYSDYIEEIRHRLSKVKQHLLNPRQREFFQHAVALFDNRTEWFQSICYAALGTPLERLRDEQEARLHDDLIFLFKECERMAVLSESLNYKIDNKEEQRSLELEAKIDAVLTGNNNLDVFTMMRMLQKRINK